MSIAVESYRPDITSQDSQTLFSSRWADSKRYVLMAVQILWLNDNCEVTLKRSTLHPTHEGRYKASDEGDLWVTTPDGRSGVVEVKHNTRNFTCAEDWPLRFPSTILDESYKYERRPPLAYMLFSQDGEHLLVADIKHKDKWFCREQVDPIWKRQARYICAPLEVVRFYKRSDCRVFLQEED